MYISAIPLGTTMQASLVLSYGNMNQAIFEPLVRAMDSLAATLEDLNVDVCYHCIPEFFDWTTPVPSLAHFKRLRCLGLPHEALIDDSGDTRETLDTILPDGIEELRIAWLHIRVRETLRDILLFPSYFKNLKRLELQPIEYRGEGYVELAVRPHKVWRDISDQGVDVYINTTEADYLMERAYENNDPEVIDFLESALEQQD
jgi:hypothetical protein